ncbi:transcription initiation factor IIB 3, partial [Halapricum sp. CBA1109]|uniref:TFIIB-type zinc ribbon-containing protein n=1 Tax=Halapricum sp. CBA1109 TaxID=2668068 RepID=UPI0013B73769
MTRSTRQRERENESTTDVEDEGVRDCPECGSENLVKSSDRGELICDDCGLVVEEENIDPGPEWRAFNHNERQEKSRV